MSTSKDSQYQMFEEIKEQLASIDRRLSRLEKQIFEDEEASFRYVLKEHVLAVDYVYREFQKAQIEIKNSLEAIKSTQNMK